jgi:hypothetical protein
MVNIAARSTISKLDFIGSPVVVKRQFIGMREVFDARVSGALAERSPRLDKEHIL